MAVLFNFSVKFRNGCLYWPKLRWKTWLKWLCSLSLSLSVVCQSRLQPVWAVRGAPQGPSRPALLHPAPKLRVATVEFDSRQHSGEHPAQSSLLGLYRWACTHSQWMHANTVSVLLIRLLHRFLLCSALCLLCICPYAGSSAHFKEIMKISDYSWMLFLSPINVAASLRKPPHSKHLNSKSG